MMPQPFYNINVERSRPVLTLGANKNATIVRPLEPNDVRRLLCLIETAWRVHLRLAPTDLRRKIDVLPGLLAEDRVGLRGFMMLEPIRPETGLIVAAGLRDTWSVGAYLDLLLPKLEELTFNNKLSSLVYVGNAVWLVDELRARGFETREWIVALERIGEQPPPQPQPMPAQIRTAHTSDLPALLALDKQAFGRVWHKSAGNFNEALATAISFAVAVTDDQLVAYEWCEMYNKHAHLTRLAVHPNYQGRGIGAQLLYQAITDALTAGAEIITLNTQENNHRSLALYRRFGFVDTQQRIPVLWKTLK